MEPEPVPTWLDMTFRPQVMPEIDLQPDGTVEISWPVGGESRITILVKPELAEEVNRRVKTLLLMVGT